MVEFEEPSGSNPLMEMMMQVRCRNHPPQLTQPQQQWQQWQSAHSCVMLMWPALMTQPCHWPTWCVQGMAANPDVKKALE